MERLIRIGGAVAGALVLIGAAYLAWSGYSSAGFLGAFPGVVLFVIGIILLAVAGMEMKR
jgi:hypothetical protein